MNFDQAKNQIRQCAAQMNARYQDVVFDEWAVVSIADNKLRVLEYAGARAADFKKRFLCDAGQLRSGLLRGSHEPGYFEFAHTGIGTGFESFMALGDGMYLIWNNTAKSMDNIVEDPRWLSAQVPFAELSARFSINPVVLAV
jgi:hypothetical protein